jgi:hypothetical protein
MRSHEEAASLFLQELAATRWDIPAFARLLGVKTHKGQQRMFDAVLMRDSTAIRAMYLNIAVSAGNRAGKTLGLAVILAFAAVHKLGLPGPDGTVESVEKWVRHPYHWYHFGVQQEVADLVWQELTMLFDGVHPAQKGRGCPLTKFLGRDSIQTEVKERGEYRWVKFDKELGGGELHFRTTNEKAIGQLGKDMNGISYDECGFDPNLSFVVNEVLHMRRLSTAGQLILIATPSEAFRQFSDEWGKGDPESPDRVAYHYSVRMSTRDNIGYGVGQEEFDRLVAAMPKHLVPQNIDGYFIEARNAFFDAAAIEQMFDPTLPEESAPQDGHSYVQGVDPALTHDATWSIVLDHTVSDRIVAVRALRREGKQSLPNLVTLISSTHAIYNIGKARCLTACDTSGMGGKVFKEALQDIHPFRGVEFGGVKGRKLKLLTDLKGYIEKGWLRFPKSGVWLDLRRQLLAYRLDDTKLKTDAVMALAVAVAQLVRGASQSSWAPTMKFDFSDWTPQPATPKHFPEESWDYGDDRGVGYVGRRLRAHYGEK